MTGVGVILGTAAYMSPEQAKGRPADKRSDIWAFGCVLYEMLTGRRAFDAEDVSETLAAVLRAEPAWDVLPSTVPAPIGAMLRRCLAKDRQRRLTHISTALFVLDGGEGAAPAPSASTAPRRQSVWPWAIGLAGVSLAIGLGLGLWGRARGPVAAATSQARFSVAIPEGVTLTNTGGHVIAMSPDGTSLVYVADNRLYVRRVAEFEPRLVSGVTAGVREPFFSPDGRWLAFYSEPDRKLKRVALSGGATLTICDADQALGASWSADNRIVFGHRTKGILAVPASGGVPQVIVPAIDGETLYGPQILPGG